ncbi:MAG: ABC transporter substrate-binding protein [Thiohalospira sp.]
MRGWLAGLLLGGAALSATAERPAVVVVTEAGSAHQQAFVQGLEGELDDAARLEQRSPEGVDGIAPGSLVVAVGERAGAAVAEARSGDWRLYGLASRGASRPWLRGDPRAAARVVEQPPRRVAALLATVLPEARRVGLLLGPSSRHYGRRLAAALEAADREPDSRRVDRESEVESVAETLFESSQVLLVPADPVVINRRTAVPLIQGAYLRGVPLIGPGRSSVRAGALMALHTDPAELGREAATDVRAALAGSPPAGHRHPLDFQVVVNYGVARALGLAVPPEPELRRQLQGGRS